MFYLWPFLMPNVFSFMSPTTTMSVSAHGWDYIVSPIMIYT